MKILKSAKKGFFALFPVFILIFVVVFRNEIINLSAYIPACPIYEKFKSLCPGCGNTRSVLAILHLDIISSVKYNIAPIILLTLAVLLYVEYIFKCFGKEIHLFPHNKYTLYALLLIFAVYCIVRNFI